MASQNCWHCKILPMKLSLSRFYCHNIVMSSNPDTMKTRRPSPTPEGEALYEMMVLIPPLYRRMRAINGRRGQLSIWSDVMWGLLSSLQLGGPRTVPQIALARGVARQRVHKKKSSVRLMPPILSSFATTRITNDPGLST